MAGLARVRRPRGAGLVAAIVIPLLVVAAGVVALARSGAAGGDTADARGCPRPGPTHPCSTRPP